MIYGKFQIILLLVAFTFVSSSAVADKVETIEGGKSPDSQMEVVNILTVKMDDGVPYYNERHYEIRNKSGKMIISEQGVFGAYGAMTVLWRSDSRFVAIAICPSKFSMQTDVYFRDGNTVKSVDMPEYEPTFDEDTTYREPYRWLKNGDLVLNITLDHHTISEPPYLGYYTTVHFSGNPPKATKVSRTKTIDRSQQ